MPEDSPQRQQRKQKERDPVSLSNSADPAPTDIVGRMIAFQRKQAAATKPRERAEKPQSSVRIAPIVGPSSPPRHKPSPTPGPSQPPPQVVVSRTESAELEEQSRRRKPQHSVALRPTGSRPQFPNPSGKLFNPDVDPIPMRRTTEPEAMSDNGSSAYAPRAGSQAREAPTHGVLYDPTKHNPMTFHNVHGRPTPNQAPAGGRQVPTPKSSGEYVSGSSTSSYAHSVTSSNFTLSSTTDGSSASSALFEQQKSGDSGTNAFAAQLKKLYRSMCNLEAALSKEDAKDFEEAPVTLKRPNEALNVDAETAEKNKWAKFRSDHKKLAEDIHELLLLTSAPHVPASLRIIPQKYNMIVRLWTYAFNKPLETLRRASHQSPIALEHLQEFIIYAYKFYSILSEEQTLENYKSGWLEALGDLARYRMAIAAMTTPAVATSALESYAAVSQQILPHQPEEKPREASEKLNDSPCASVGIGAANLMELQPEKERWRCIAREWYAAGLSDTPGAGKLHHHLGLLSRETESEELRAVYHFVKSLTALHPFSTSRESVLPIWSMQAQMRRSLPDACVSDLFVLLHGMLFTNVQLDDFQPTLSRLTERLQLDGAEEREWIMMGIINIAAILQYGKGTSILKRHGSAKDSKDADTADSEKARVNIVTQKMDEMEVDGDESGDKQTEKDKDYEMEDEDKDLKGSGVLPISSGSGHAAAHEEIPTPLKYAFQLTFAILSYTLRHPTRKASSFARPTLNPYNSIILTFLATILKSEAVLAILEREIPWQDMATFFCTMPRRALREAEGGLRLTSGCMPLPEDWCIRGMEWVGRKVYDRGFWKGSEEQYAEMEVLDHVENVDGATDGIIEDGDGDDEATKAEISENGKRWIRIIRAAAGLATIVPGFEKESGQMRWRVTGVLEQKVKMWQEEERKRREEEEKRRMRRRWNEDDMEVDEEETLELDELSEESDDDDDDSEEIKILKARRRELIRLLRSARNGKVSPQPRRQTKVRGAHKPKANISKPTLRVVAGFTVLVADTNILLSSLKIFASLVESLRWTIVVPLAVITELDGLKANNSPLGEAAHAAVSYVVSHLRSHSLSLKVQTSKGNYLSTISVRSEEIEFTHDSWERNMDDLILRAAVWHDEHWVDRSAILNSDVSDTTGAAKVVLISFDRNLRLKARSRQLNAADEKDLAAILKAGA